MKKIIFGLTALLFSVSLMTAYASGDGPGSEGSDKEADRKAAIADKKAQMKEDRKAKQEARKAEAEKKKAEREAKKAEAEKKRAEKKNAETETKKPVYKGRPDTKPSGKTASPNKKYDDTKPATGK